MTTMDALILPGSQRKRDPENLREYLYYSGATPVAPAWAVYDGPLVRIARKYAPYRDLDIFFLSARFGLIQASYLIPPYDQKMMSQQAANPEWIGTYSTVPWMRIGAAGFYENVYTCLPRLYQAALIAGLHPFGIEPVPIVRVHPKA